MVTGSLRVGGLEKVALSCVQYADCDRVKFDFLVFDNESGGYEEKAMALGCRVLRIKGPSSGYYSFYKNVCGIIKENGPYDIVHSHTFFNSGIVLMAAKACGVQKRIAHSHSIKRKGHLGLPKRVYNMIMRKLIVRYATDFCACSEAAGSYLFGKKVSSRLIIVPNIIDFAKFMFSDSDRRTIRQELNFKLNDKIVGFVGHLTPVKNPLFIVKIAETFSFRTDVRFLIVGDGPLRGELEKRINEKNLKDKIILTGIRNDVQRIMSALDLLICPSLNEGLGIVLLEAQANGLISIAEKTAIVKEVSNLNGCQLINGFDNLDLWKGAINQFLDKGHSMALVEVVKKSKFTPKELESVLHTIYGYEEIA